MQLLDTISRRRSVRSYNDNPVSRDILDRMASLAASAPCPWDDASCRVSIIDRHAGATPEKLGTYGMIRNARHFLILSAQPADTRSLLAAGYAMEHIILEATGMGLATCWLGGTFSRKDFRAAATVEAGQKIICVSPFGYPSKKRSLIERLSSRIAGSNNRKPFSALFFDSDFDHPYPTHGRLSHAFEAVRLAPSASNRQPWRITAMPDGQIHIFGAKDPGFLAIDIGIAMAHFDIALGHRSEWAILPEAPIGAPAGLTYMVSTRV